MKLLLLGPDGQVGWELRRALAPLGDLIVLGRTVRSGGLSGNLADPAALTATLRALRPDVVVNAAAYTAVDKAESDVEAATAVNAVAPGVIARELATWSGWLVHYSTDYVFDGSGTAPRDELAATGPLGVYGHTKLAGEEAIRSSGCHHLILRTSWVHAARGGNFARTMLRLAGQRDSLGVVDDQIGAPTGADLLADVTAHALRAASNATELSGTYHACASGAVSWCDYARHVIAWGHRAGLPLKATADSVKGIPTRDYPSPATRPLNSRLDTRKLCRSFGLTLPDWRLGVDRMLDEVFPTLTAIPP
ncbi:dTDP-4-dehydrorhamnose reductase [Ideonella sp. A 288]|uniref:dTDP-4-dehydrorhamnose reductase n=1 Tax=Ideonella sp. A 288 TaxID=1962181 RepID=UPI000B4B9052|nr:dTDP-4-dehydrorhamnose reductase [Ideonella sp. A 288]